MSFFVIFLKQNKVIHNYLTNYPLILKNIHNHIDFFYNNLILWVKQLLWFLGIQKVCSYFFIVYDKFITKFYTVVDNFVDNFYHILL